MAIDPRSRSGRPSTRRAPTRAFVAGLDARPAWTRYALDAPVMMIRGDDGACTSRSTSACRSVRGSPTATSSAGPRSTTSSYHLTTLFPPVRPRGWLELRMIDALPDRWWPVAVAVATRCSTTPKPRTRAATRRCRRPAVAGSPRRGTGSHDPALARRRRTRASPPCSKRSPRLGADADTIAATAEFCDRYVARGRSPADDAARRVERPPGGDETCAVTAGPSQGPRSSPRSTTSRRRTLGLLDPDPRPPTSCGRCRS